MKQFLILVVCMATLLPVRSQTGQGSVVIDSLYSENLGVTHFAEEYIGTHTSGIYTRDGRIPNQMLPFFDCYLEFE